MTLGGHADGPPPIVHASNAIGHLRCSASNCCPGIVSLNDVTSELFQSCSPYRSTFKSADLSTETAATASRAAGPEA